MHNEVYISRMISKQRKRERRCEDAEGRKESTAPAQRKVTDEGHNHVHTERGMETTVNGKHVF